MLLVSMVVGVRLLLLARRTRMIPELVMGVSSLGVGVGSALVVQGSALLEAQAQYASAVFIAGVTGTSLGALFLGLGVWKIFRAREQWALWPVVASAVVLAGSLISLVFNDAPGRSPAEQPAYFAGFAIRLAMYVWLAVESIAYGRVLQRRVRIGLADPLMASRFFCWGASGTTAFGGYLVYFACAWQGIAPPPLVSVGLGLIGLVTAGAMWLAFFPPAFYAGWIGCRIDDPTLCAPRAQAPLT